MKSGKNIIKKMTPEQKLKTAQALYWSARKLKKAALRNKYPDLPEEELEKMVKEIFLYASS